MAAFSPPTAVDLPITDVVVFSDRARITRTAAIPPGPQRPPRRILLPPLPASAAPDTVRLQADGAEVLQVEIAPLSGDAFTPAEARAALAALEQAGDQLARLQGELSARMGIVRLAQSLRPSLPADDTHRPYPRLNPGGWDGVLNALRSFTERQQQLCRDLERRIADLQEQRRAHLARVQKLGAAGQRGAYRVIATLGPDRGGPARLQLTYLVSQARWLPRYDIQLRPQEGRVELSFAALVSQESGEDWQDARLTLSTAVPSTITELPRLLTWKIGEKERFIPTPQPVPPQLRPPPQAPPLAESLERAELRQRLAAAMGRGVSPERDDDGKDANAPAYESIATAAKTEAKKEQADYRPPPPPAAPAAAAPAEPAPTPARVLREESLVLSRAPRGRTYKSVLALSPGSTAGSYTPTTRLGLMPPPGWQPPYLAPELPASQAGGYDLSYAAVGKESVRSGGGQRRVPLFSQGWPVTVHHRIYPALAQEAYLVAELKNLTGQPLPGGTAHLSVGADAAGVAQLKLVAPGEVFTLPLGLDREIKPARNVQVVSSERGLISKDEIAEYTVTTEVANPYPRPLSLRVSDQVPVTQDRQVTIALVRAEPQARYDRDRGTLDWQLQVPPGQKAQVRFIYTLKRPKALRMTQGR